MDATIDARAAGAVPSGPWPDALRRLRADRLSMAAFAVLAVQIALALAAPLLSEHVFRFTFSQQDLARAYATPTLDPPAYLLGSDHLGRSQVVRLLYGGQVSLMVGFFAAVVQMTLGVAIGLLAGYRRGWLDDALTFVVTVFQSLPVLFLLLVVSALFDPGPLLLVVVLGCIGWTGITLLVRGQTFALREREFVIAARALGATGTHIVWRHILPNMLPLIFVLAAIDVGAIILIESSLSFLGLGITPPTPSWGNMLSNAASYFSLGWWLVLSPGLMIFLTVLSLYLAGDGLRDALDPRARGAR